MPAATQSFSAIPEARGQVRPEARALRRQLAQSPVAIGAWHDLAALALVADEIPSALARVLRARAVHPQDPGLRRLQAFGLLRLADVRHHHLWRGPRPWRHPAEKPEESELRAATDLLVDLAREKPDETDLFLSLGAAHQARGRHDDASRSYRRALALAPDNLQALNNLGAVFADRLERRAGEDWLRRSLGVAPDYAEGWNNLASLRLHDGRPASAIAAARRALDLRPGWAEPTWNRALAQLATGDLASGFAGYEARFGLSEAGIAPAIAKRWTGPSLPPGPEVVVRAEQGYGDMLHFARYLPLLKEQGLFAVLECHAALAPLLETVPGVARIAPLNGPFPEGPAQVSLLSLPHLMGTRLETIPAKVPYLAAPAGRLARWKERLASLPGPRIGLNWQGNPAFRRDRERSPGFAPIRPLLDLGSFIGLVRDPAPDHTHPNLTHLGPDFADFADTAACLQQLDLVITSDTALAHLAGALARPTWLLLHHAPDWRWLETRTDSPWYPTFRLFRQTTPGDWTAVIRHVATQLQGFKP